MKSKINKKLLLGFSVIFLFFTSIVYAVSSTDFYTKAKKFIDNNCSKVSLSNEASLNCFLYYKVFELESLLSGHTSRILVLELNDASQSARLVQLENRNIVLEHDIATMSALLNISTANTAEEITVLPVGGIVDGGSSEIFDVGNHQLIVFNGIYAFGNPAEIHIFYSDDQSIWTEDLPDLPINSGNEHPQLIKKIKARYYKLIIQNPYGTPVGVNAILY